MENFSIEKSLDGRLKEVVNAGKDQGIGTGI